MSFCKTNHTQLLYPACSMFFYYTRLFEINARVIPAIGFFCPGGHCVIVSMKPQATPVAKVVNPLGTVVTIHSDTETEQEEFEEPVIHENCDEALFRPILVSKATRHTEGKPHTSPIDPILVRSLDGNTEVTVKLLNKSKNVPFGNSTNRKSKHISEEVNISSTEQKNSNRNTIFNEKEETKKDDGGSIEIRDKAYSFHGISERHDTLSLESNEFPSFPVPPEDLDYGLALDENKHDFDFAYLDNKNEEMELKTDMFEDATDCYDDIYINMKKEIAERNEENLSEEKITPSKPRKPKTKLGVRIPNKHFPIKNEEVDLLMPKRSWSAVAAAKPKEKVVDISEKENCDLLDLSEEKGMKKSFNSNIKNVKLIHIEKPADEDAAIEIIEPALPEFKKNNWYTNALDKSSDEEKLVDLSGETTESDDSGKLPVSTTIANEFISQDIVPIVTKASKKKSKKKRK